MISLNVNFDYFSFSAHSYVLTYFHSISTYLLFKHVLISQLHHFLHLYSNSHSFYSSYCYCQCLLLAALAQKKQLIFDNLPHFRFHFLFSSIFYSSLLTFLFIFHAFHYSIFWSFLLFIIPHFHLSLIPCLTKILHPIHHTVLISMPSLFSSYSNGIISHEIIVPLMLPLLIFLFLILSSSYYLFSQLPHTHINFHSQITLLSFSSTYFSNIYFLFIHIFQFFHSMVNPYFTSSSSVQSTIIFPFSNSLSLTFCCCSVVLLRSCMCFDSCALGLTLMFLGVVEFVGRHLLFQLLRHFIRTCMQFSGSFMGLVLVFSTRFTLNSKHLFSTVLIVHLFILPNQTLLTSWRFLKQSAELYLLPFLKSLFVISNHYCIIQARQNVSLATHISIMSAHIISQISIFLEFIMLIFIRVYEPLLFHVQGGSPLLFVFIHFYQSFG